MAKDKQKLDRKTLKEDAFQDTVFWAIHWFYKHRLRIIVGATAVVLLLAGGVGYRYYLYYEARQQAQDFHVAEKDFLAPNLAVDKRLAEGKVRFEMFLKDHPNGSLAPVAWMYLARIAWEQKHIDAAKAAFQHVVDHSQSTEAMRELAKIGIAKAEEAKGNLDGAEKIYTGLPDGTYRELKDYSLGRIAMEQHQPEQARKYFDKVAKTLPATALSEWATQALDYLP